MSTLSIVLIVLGIIAVLWIILGFVFAIILTSSSGEKFTFSKQNIIFIFIWPFFFLADWSH